MNEEQLKNAARQYQNWSDGELVRATAADKQGYQEWALALMEQELFRRGIPPSERKCVEKVALEHVEGKQKPLAGIPWLLLLFVIVVLLGSLFNAIFGVGVLYLFGVAFLSEFGNEKIDALGRVNSYSLIVDTGMITLSGVLFLILAGYGFSIASKAMTAIFYHLIRKPSTASPHAERLVFHGLLLIVLEALLVWLSLYL
jgi:hypothetical protein